MVADQVALAQREHGATMRVEVGELLRAALLQGVGRHHALDVCALWQHQAHLELAHDDAPKGRAHRDLGLQPSAWQHGHRLAQWQAVPECELDTPAPKERVPRLQPHLHLLRAMTGHTGHHIRDEKVTGDAPGQGRHGHRM